MQITTRCLQVSFMIFFWKLNLFLNFVKNDRIDFKLIFHLPIMLFCSLVDPSLIVSSIDINPITEGGSFSHNTLSCKQKSSFLMCRVNVYVPFAAQRAVFGQPKKIENNVRVIDDTYKNVFGVAEPVGKQCIYTLLGCKEVI